jgi:Family of unknown function (DUF6232)
MDSQDLVDVQDPRVVFYPLRRGVLVTDGWFCAERHRLALAEIADVGWRQSGGHVTRRVARAIMLTEITLVAVVAAVATEIGGLSIIAFGLAAVHLAVAALVTWLNAYRYPGPLQLWAKRIGGPQLLLFSSSDQTEFHKVRRALERAVEYHQELAF